MNLELFLFCEKLKYILPNNGDNIRCKTYPYFYLNIKAIPHIQSMHTISHVYFVQTYTVIVNIIQDKL